MDVKRRTRVAGLVLAALAVLGLLSAPAAHAARGRVVTAGFTFTPPALALPRGSSLTLINADLFPHQVVADNGQFSSPVTGFRQASRVSGVSQLGRGVYTYHCGIHFFMRGTLTIV